jgi:hypothetical protein
MSFYLRKSLRAGPFRFNLSRSGVGVSVGVPGFRVGSGPRGNYVRVGKAGVYYRTTPGATTTPALLKTPEQPTWQPPVASDVVMEDTTGAAVTALAPTGPGDLVEQLNEAESRFPLAWIAVIATIVLALVASGTLGWIVLVLGLIGSLWLALRDQARRSVVTFYEVEDQSAVWFQSLLDAHRELTAAKGLWRIEAAGAVTTTRDFKVNAGAGTLVSRTKAKATSQGPRALKTNISVPSVTAGKSSLHFLPDRVLVHDGRRFSDVAYSALEVADDVTRFIEDGRVPRDGIQVDTTWKYVNIKGGPDRRYKENPKLPVMAYDRLVLASDGGLAWILDCSRQGAAPALRAAVSSAIDPEIVEGPAVSDSPSPVIADHGTT